MTEEIRIGVVGAGNRGMTHIENLCSIRDQDYLLADRPNGYPHTVYETYAAEQPDWRLNVADLEPRITAVFSPSAETTGRNCSTS